jgi:hypothetical protein
MKNTVCDNILICATQNPIYWYRFGGRKINMLGAVEDIFFTFIQNIAKNMGSMDITAQHAK